MGKLRHVAIQVPDLEKAAAFYEGAFDLQPRQPGREPDRQCDLAVRRRDEPHPVAFPGRHQGRQRRPGLGRACITSASWSRTKKATAEKIKKLGGTFFMQLPSYPGVDAEKKFKDVNGIVFDVAEHDWRQAKAMA